ncbi:hypothetical protein O1B53_003876 [Vibrio cholerae]|nr:hypothetical protein [Vibrio cholerae]
MSLVLCVASPLGGRYETRGKSLEHIEINEIFVSQAGAFSEANRKLMELLVKLHEDFNAGQFGNWPTVIFATQLGTLGISMLSILPSAEKSEQIVDMRSIASLIRNVVDTHDALDMLVNEPDPLRFQLHRDILGYYIAGRYKEVQKRIAPEKAQAFYKYTSVNYWENIRNSPLYSKKIERLKNSEGIFYQSRKERVERVFKSHANFIQGILADISTYVHSLPPTNFFSSLDDQCKNTPRNIGLLAVWVQLLNVYMARCVEIIYSVTSYEIDDFLGSYMQTYQNAFGGNVS